ncbi:MAG: glycine cleavage system aminomethyltransferase GcvT [Bacteroidales bacterium]|nr:glycine cleavage system aminomethyltransferase GcvT [Bacteroidales bacterium]
MKNLPIHDRHIEMGGKMVPFAGYNMPIEYSGVIDEHLNVRNNVGIFDVSHMGIIWIKGNDACQFLQKLTSNDVLKLYRGRVQYSCFPNGKGGIIDDLLVYMFDEKKYMLVVNASNIQKDWEWLNKHKNNFNVELENSSDHMGIFAVQGPNSTQVLKKIINEDFSGLKHYHFIIAKIYNNIEIILSTTGYTGETGYEIYFSNENAELIWKYIFKSGKPLNIKPAGLAARDTLRLEMGYCLYGNDINENTSPIEAGLGWITKFNDNNNFIDKEYLYQQQKNGIEKTLVGFDMIDRGIPRKGYKIFSESKTEIGFITSGTMSPMLKRGIGMGYIKTEFNKPGNIVFIEIRNKLLKAKVVKFPIYKKD